MTPTIRVRYLEAVDLLVSEGTPATAPEIAIDLRRNVTHVRASLSSLVGDGLLESPGVGGRAGYVLTPRGAGLLREAQASHLTRTMRRAGLRR